MAIDTHKSVSIFFTSKNWYFKLGLGLAFIFLFLFVDIFYPKNFLLRLISYLLLIFPYGYVNLTIHSELQNKEELLPEWNLKKCAISQILAGLIKLFYVPLLFIPMLIPFIIIKISPILGAILMLFTIIPAILIYIVVMWVAEYSYFRDFNFSQAFNFAQIIEIIKNGFRELLIALLWMLFLMAVFCTIMGIILLIESTLPGTSGDILSAAKQYQTLNSQIKLILYYLLLFITSNIFAQAYKIASAKAIDGESMIFYKNKEAGS